MRDAHGEILRLVEQDRLKWSDVPARAKALTKALRQAKFAKETLEAEERHVAKSHRAERVLLAHYVGALSIRDTRTHGQFANVSKKWMRRQSFQKTIGAGRGKPGKLIPRGILVTHAQCTGVA